MTRWTDERDAELRALHAKGMTKAAIARDMTASLPADPVSRNAVIGRLHRLGIRGGPVGRKPGPPRDPPAQKRRPAPQRALTSKPAPAPKAKPTPPPTPEIALPPREDAWKPLPGTEPRALLDLGLQQCRWPVGDGTGARQMFCAAGTGEGCSYCPVHTLLSLNRHPLAGRTRPSDVVQRAKVANGSRPYGSSYRSAAMLNIIGAE